MTARTLCLILFDAAEAEWLIPATATLGLSLDAHVIGVHPWTPVLHLGESVSEPMVYPNLVALQRDQTQQIRARFEHITRINTLPAEFRSQTELFGTEEFALSAARGADVVVMAGNAAPGRSPDDRALAQRIIRDLGRPVLVLSQTAALSHPAKRLLVAWSETREATRAAHDALALAAPGAEIDLVTMLPRPATAKGTLDSRADLAAALDRRGYRVTLTDRIAPAGEIAPALVELTEETGAELLVAGAFGHSYLHDLLLGAVTRDLLATSDVPLLLAH